MKTHALRLRPGNDLRQEIAAFSSRERIRAGIVLTCVGSVRKTVLRYADQKNTATLDGKREIVSLVGTFGTGGMHLHLAVSDGAGQTLGGHLSDGTLIYTTAEIVLARLDYLEFDRVDDPETGFKELVIRTTRTL